MPTGHYKRPQNYGEVMSKTARKGEDSPRWKGDKVSYCGLHKWVYKVLGQPDTCKHCNKSQLKGHKIHWANKSGQYAREVSDWIRLCIPCHRIFDKKTPTSCSKCGEKYKARGMCERCYQKEYRNNHSK